MAVRTRKFTIGHGATVRAVKVTEENFLAVANWVGNGTLALVKQGKTEEELSNHRVRVRTPFGIRTAFVGDWIYKNLDDEKFYVAKQEEVDEKFVAVPSKPRNKEKE